MKNNSSKKNQKQAEELDRIAKMLIRRDLKLSELREKREEEVQELDRITKMLVRRDFELSRLRERREKILKKLEKRTKELTRSRKALMNILEDVKEARAEAEAERDKTLATINNLADGLLVFDKRNKLSLINPKAENFFKIKEDLTGKSTEELLDSSLKPLVKLLGKEIKEISRKELKVREGLTLEVSTVPMAKEERAGTLVILHDVTREKRIEKMKTEFVALAAHQLRTPLSAIKWTLRMLLDEDLGKINKEQREFIEKTYKSNERMITLINDLLNVTRIEEGRYLYKPKLVHLEDLIQGIIDSSKEELKKRKLELNFKKEEIPEVRVDVEKIKLAIRNLLDNAMRYTPEGGKITISLKEEEDKVKFLIRDNGIGIPKEQQDRVFTKFFRGANAVRTETEGSGLGLFIVKNIIEAHEGKIWFESERGKGTTFYFTIPVERKEFEKFVEGS